MARALKATKTALWPRRIFSARMSAKTGVRVFAMEKNQNAKGIRVEAVGNLKPETGNLKKRLSSIFGRLFSVLRFRWYSLCLRFKRCDMPSSSSLRSEACGLIFPANKTKGFCASFCKPARISP